MAYKKIAGIYKITSPSNKIYIGKSKNLSQRKNDYKNRTTKIKSQRRLYNSIVKYGWVNHVFEIIEECEIIDLYCRERYWQEYYEVIGENGLNCILQKCEEHPADITDETRKKMSAASKGKNNSMYGKDWREGKTQEELEQHKKNMSNSLKGRVKSEETRKKLSENNARVWKGVKGEGHPTYGLKLSDERKDKIREFMLSDKNPHKGKKRSPESVQKTIDALSKPVFNHETGEKLPSVKELSLLIGKSIGCIRQQLLENNSNTIGWVYKENLNKPLYKKIKKDPFTKEELEIIKNNTKKELMKLDRLLYRRLYRYNKKNNIN